MSVVFIYLGAVGTGVAGRHAMWLADYAQARKGIVKYLDADEYKASVYYAKGRIYTHLLPNDEAASRDRIAAKVVPAEFVLNPYIYAIAGGATLIAVIGYILMYCVATWRANRRNGSPTPCAVECLDRPER